LTNVIRLDGSRGDGDNWAVPNTGMAALRLATGMGAGEFSAALGEELGWPVPLFVFLRWEIAGAQRPPAEVLDAARTVSMRNPIAATTPRIGRREFLGGVVGLSTLSAAGLPVAAGVLGIGVPGRKWRDSGETAADLEALIGSYRRAYAEKAAVADLLPGATGMMHLLIDLGRRHRWPASPARLASLVGQAAVLAGLLHLMGRRDLSAARAHYELALQAAREAEDWDLASYVLGSLAFEAASGRRAADGRGSARPRGRWPGAAPTRAREPGLPRLHRSSTPATGTS
jgi:hypothetical protein